VRGKCKRGLISISSLKFSSVKGGGEVFRYYVVPSKVVARKTAKEGAWYSFSERSAQPYRDKWALLGFP
jgi:hypothetical protein